MDNEADFLKKFQSVGSENFYNYLLSFSMEKLALYLLYREAVKESKSKIKAIPHPHIMLQSYYDKFIVLYRRDSDPKHLEIAKMFRRVAHKIYRVMLKKNLTNIEDGRFLRIV